MSACLACDMAVLCRNPTQHDIDKELRQHSLKAISTSFYSDKLKLVDSCYVRVSTIATVLRQSVADLSPHWRTDPGSQCPVFSAWWSPGKTERCEPGSVYLNMPTSFNGSHSIKWRQHIGFRDLTEHTERVRHYAKYLYVYVYIYIYIYIYISIMSVRTSLMPVGCGVVQQSFSV